MDAKEMTTYKRADGGEIGDGYGWVTDLEYFEGEWSPVELVRERWVLAASETFWQMPDQMYDCDVDHCDEDAVEWVQREDYWNQLCAEHAEQSRSNTGDFAPGVTAGEV